MLSQGMINATKRKKQKNFETILENASNELINKKISAMQFLNIMSESNHDNHLINHDWGLSNSRVDLKDDDNSDIENDEDSTESE